MTNQKGFTHIAITVVSFIVATVIFVGAWWLFFGGADDVTINTNTTAVIDSFEDCIAAGYPAMESYPRQCSTGSETFTEVIVNVNASIPISVTTEMLLTNPAIYIGKEVCVTGYYQYSFEFMAMAVKYNTDTEGRKILQPPYIWMASTINENELECTSEENRARSCFGKITACGLFEVSDDEGFGAYDYRLTSTTTSSTNTNTTVNVNSNTSATDD